MRAHCLHHTTASYLVVNCLLGGCGPHFPEIGDVNNFDSSDDTAAANPYNRSIVGGVTAYQGHSLGAVTVGLLDADHDATWGTDDLMVVVDETVSADNGTYALQVAESSTYWLLGSYEALNYETPYTSLHYTF